MWLPEMWCQFKSYSETCAPAVVRSKAAGIAEANAVRPSSPRPVLVLRHEAVEPNPFPPLQYCQYFPSPSLQFSKVCDFSRMCGVCGIWLHDNFRMGFCNKESSIFLDRAEEAHSYPFQSILTLCSKVRIVVIITEVHFCFIAMRKLLVSASILPSCSYHKKKKTAHS